MSDEARCEFCHATYDEMEQVGGEPAGWAVGLRRLCLGPKCISQRTAARKIADRKRAGDRRKAVNPVRKSFAAAMKRKREKRDAKRLKIAADRERRKF